MFKWEGVRVMREDKQGTNYISAGTSCGIPTESPIQPLKEVSETLRIAQKVEQFVNDNGWSWCQMDQVYRILKVAHQ
jgi:hypothetical protein